MLRTDAFDYDLPLSSIAQHPVEPRDACRLLVLRRSDAGLSHHLFRDLPELLQPGDLLVINDTQVIPARLHVHKLPGGGRAEILLLAQEEDDLVWEAWIGGGGMTAGRRFEVADGFGGVILEVLPDGRRLIRFEAPVSEWLEQCGEMPLPPYIHEPLRHPMDYQTVYASRAGSAAAPTAGLHFTPELLARLRACGIGIVTTTLHVGLDTFAPVKEDEPSRHAIHTEWCQVDLAATEQIRNARRQGHRVVAVGTTSVRTLETAARAASPDEIVAPFSGPTALYILPGFSFQVVDGMVTNFHLPRSTLLMLVSAFAGRESVLHAYAVAREAGYRFYSFGDAMLIL
jgi:S-adenosylmethionine:tRNA ribosyltransferase-isomerase